MSELSVTGLTKRFGQVDVLRGVDLTVPSGSLVSVLGPSGCGKTTLLRLVAGFDRADAGEVRLAGSVVESAGPQRKDTHLPPEKRRIGVVPQEGALFPHLSVARNVGYGLSRSARRSGRVEQLLELVGLAGLGDRMPHELSGGQQQRVAAARALAPRPSLVLLDEPFNALDAALRGEIRADLRAALRADGATAVLVTHDQEEALSMSDAVAVMRDGRIVQTAPPVELYSQPADLLVANFLGDAVVLEGEVHQGRVRTALGELAARGGPTSGPVQVLLRPEQIRLSPLDGPIRAGDGTAGDRVIATVLDETYFGHDALVQVEVPGLPPLFSRSLGGSEVRVGDRVTLDVAGDVSCYAGRP